MFTFQLLLTISSCSSFQHYPSLLQRKNTPATWISKVHSKSYHNDDDPFGDYDDDGYYYNDSDNNGYTIIDDNESNLDEHTVIDKDDEEEEQKKSHFYSRKELLDPSFYSGTSPKIFKRLCDSVNIERPSKIQALAWPAVLQGSHAVVADQTGSGKTLAYLVPLLQLALLKKKEKTGRPPPGCPQILVLAPTAELADQIFTVCEKIRASIPEVRTMVLTATGAAGITSIRDQIRALKTNPVTILVSTPGRIATLLRSRGSSVNLQNLDSMVLDEVDVLLQDDSFGSQLRTIAAAAPPLDQLQFLFVTATLPETIVETVTREFGGFQLRQIRGPGLHRVAPSLKETLVDVSVPSNKLKDPRFCFDVKSEALVKALRNTPSRRTLIFCNTVESCRSVENFLKRKYKNDLTVGAYHNAMAADARNANYRTFVTSNKKHLKSDFVLVCTDRASRGVDFEGTNVDHVVIFDFPKDPSEYVRRVGRTARAGRTGTATVFAYGWQLPIARQIRNSARESIQEEQRNKNDAGDDAYDYRGGLQRRRKQQDPWQRQDEMIKGNIEGGKLWTKRL
eukprot:CAMPEP_0194257222 /NCGR_PEP_ID=MMETSP0158-20130606/38495_1 /TAXON_ID=33649 /ORGANISM="Thalassionema nitzschioides, Strain L26-B" /LENGTH=564 /DNA_ID=CAMNT_0038996189 /DNA_START=30 /DNA_END=1721 /DNA_ORIENTATION=+